ncbi:glycoside hydrolase family 88 protein [Cohnella sp. REN36]|uniref:glycoside hydrolase family 88 protein n=1 Tax=Cohnella sp. REN36 TaxID=2887347 RepID=UPI001D14DB92|nr:glycoside hydrolase family 88 protein [Cohnella sp. REN36]MCC3375512.1 glycoside hydrolase family 88 protein [Cohnella sp. REN36]
MSHWSAAIEDALGKTRRNIGLFGDAFPHVSTDGEGGRRYSTNLNPNTDWTDGFWSGILWLSYQYSGDEAFRSAAARTVESFRQRLAGDLALDHHDIGFLYSLSAKAQWIVEKDESARRLALDAADKLMSRFREKGQYIQAWGPEGDPVNGGRIIIDCLMNLPLLYWAYEQTGEERYRRTAIVHADKSRRYLVRGDDSSYHTFHFKPETGEPIGGDTHQGYTNGSTWTRGQAWGIYGFALSYRYSRDPLYLETSKRLAKYFLERLPEDGVVYWDFNAPVNAETYRDSSASAIASAGILELLGHLEASDPDRGLLEEGLQRSMTSLVRHYATIGDDGREGFIKRGSYHVLGNFSPDDLTIWGDYFYLEALMRLERGMTGYWYA